MNLKEFQKKHGIRRIDFDQVEPSDYEEQYAEDELICPYCKTKIKYDVEEINDILDGTPYQCPCCEKWFYAEGEISVDTTCTPMEDKVLDGFTKKYIEDTYSYMDKCDSKGCEWDNPYGCVEYELYKQYSEPLFENMKAGNENDDE